jgi:pentatricopeptide repeat protein
MSYNLPPLVRSKKELQALVDQCADAGTVEEHLQFFRDPYLRGYAPADGPNIVISNRQDDVEFPSHDQVTQASGYEQNILHQLRIAVISRLRHPLKWDLEHIYRIYRQLPEPRMSYLYATLRHQLLRVLGQPEKRDSQSMLRYFEVVAVIKNSGLPLTRAEWNSAISFASRYVGTSTAVEAESALNLWREMEQDAGIKANDVTFNILFDVASKAGNFTLAEMIYTEMERRGFPFNRYHHVSLIHFFGLKLDGNGVRAAYKEMVDAGEIIDTVVLNCVISGLLRSGEEEAAQRVYERMRSDHARAETLPARDYVTNKVITKVFMMFAKVGHQHPVMRASFQSLAPIAPDLQTYRVLINHYAIKVGNLARVAQLLDEMKFFKIPLHGAIFLALFKGFCRHGGYSGSPWSEQRLISIWTALLEALDDGVDGLFIQTWLAVWTLRAFKKCSSNKLVLQVFEAMELRWDLSPADSQFMADFLHNILSKDGASRYQGTYPCGGWSRSSGYGI